MAKEQIKFRAWDKRNKRMVDVVGLSWYWKDVDGISEMFIEESDGSITRITSHGIKDFELMQFTGLRDSKRTEEYPEGQPIFEGDIIRYKWDDEIKIDVITFLPPMFSPSRAIRWDLSKDEVIGNIYENPELFGGDTHAK